MKKENLPKQKKKIEFSKIAAAIIAVCLFAFAIWSGIEYYVLTKLAITSTAEGVSPTLPDASLAIACITSILGVFVGYCLYQLGCKDSLNKNGLQYDQLSGCTKRLPINPYSNEVEDIVEKKKTNKGSKKSINKKQE